MSTLTATQYQERAHRRRRRQLLRTAHPDAGGSAETFVEVMRQVSGGRPVRVHVWRRRSGLLGLLDDLRRARGRRTTRGRAH